MYKKLLLTIILTFICSLAHAATTYYACTSGGTWSASIWVTSTGAQAACTGGTTIGTANNAVLNASSGNVTIGASVSEASLNETGYSGTLAFGTFTLTLTAGATLQGIMSSTSGIISVTGGGVTLAATPTGTTFPTLTLKTAAQTLTSGGFSWPGALNLDYAGTITLLGNWVNSGLVTWTLATNLNQTTNETFTGNGGLTMTATSGTTSTAPFIFEGGTLAFGTRTLSAPSGITLSGAMTSTSGTLIVSGGGITLAGTPTGSFPLLEFTTAGQTLTSGGFTWPGKLTFNYAGTFTLLGNWVNTGLVTILAPLVLNSTTTETFTENGGITVDSNTSGTAGIINGGGTWSATGVASGTISNNFTFAGDSTVSGTVGYRDGTLTWVSGTITTTGSTFDIFSGVATPVTINTPSTGMSWNNILIYNTASVIFNANLNLTGALVTMWEDTTFSGTFTTITMANFSVMGTFTSVQGAVAQTFPAGTILNVTSGLNLYSGPPYNGATSTTTIQSGTPSSPIYLNYTGTAANCVVADVVFTDVNASGSSQTIYDYGATPSILTRTTNIIPINQNNIGGGFIQ